MGLCQADCANIDLIDIVNGGCETKRRKRGLYRLGFYKCDTELPSPLTCANFEALVDSKAVVFSNPLISNFEDPTTEDVQIADCLPAITESTGRRMTFEDHIAVDVPADATATPAIVANPFADLKFWANKNRIGLNLRFVFLWCDGTIEVPRGADGKPLSGAMTVFRSLVKQGSGTDSYVLEIKKGTINFKGDPLALREDYAPDLIIDTATCDTLAAKLGINI